MRWLRDPEPSCPQDPLAALKGFWCCGGLGSPRAYKLTRMVGRGEERENYLFKTAFQTPPGLRLCPCVPSPAQSTCGQAAAAWRPRPPSAPHRGIRPWPAGHGHQKRTEKGKEAEHVCTHSVQAGLKTQMREEKLHQLINRSLQFLLSLPPLSSSKLYGSTGL